MAVYGDKISTDQLILAVDEKVQQIFDRIQLHFDRSASKPSISINVPTAASDSVVIGEIPGVKEVQSVGEQFSSDIQSQKKQILIDYMTHNGLLLYPTFKVCI